MVVSIVHTLSAVEAQVIALPLIVDRPFNVVAEAEDATSPDSRNPLPEEYILWNNEEVEKTQKLINLDLSNWIISNEII